MSTTRTDAKEKCASCGLTRDAHWGAHPICEGVCTGFVSSGVAVGINAELLAALKALTRVAERDVFIALDEEEASQHRELSEAIDNANTVIKRAEGQEKE
jgi:hypothetical protein